MSYGFWIFACFFDYDCASPIKLHLDLYLVSEQYVTENLDHHRSSSMGFRNVHPSTKKELKARRQALAAYRQNGAAISGFAQMFWTLAVGLQFKDSELIQVFNSCLDYPLFSEEMTELKTLGYWGFVDLPQLSFSSGSSNSKFRALSQDGRQARLSSQHGAYARAFSLHGRHFCVPGRCERSY